MSKYSFRKYQPLSLRLWHWINALVILGLILTVVLRKTFLSWRTNSALIQEKLGAQGVTVTPELAKEIAVAIRNPLWDVHIFLGYVLGGLILGRLAIAFFVEKKFFSPPPMAEITKDTLHFWLVKTGYAVFYLATLLMVATGFLLIFKDDLAISKDFAGTVKEVHEVMMWFFVVFVLGHIAGVVLAENRTDPGLVSDMIHGGKDNKLD